MVKKTLVYDDNIFSFGLVEELDDPCRDNKYAPQELRELVQQGKAVIVSSFDIIGALKNLTDDEVFYLKHDYSLRTNNYLEAIKSRVKFVKGLYGYDDPEYDSKPRVIGHLNFGFTDAPVELGRIKNEFWCASYGYQTAIDDYVIEQLYFSDKPSLNDIKTLLLVRDVKTDFSNKNLRDTFDCWECGAQTHWLDIEGSFQDKVEKLKDSYCGC